MFKAERTFCTIRPAPSSESPGKFSGKISMCNLPLVKMGNHQTLTVSELCSLSTLLGLRKLEEWCCVLLLIHPLPLFLARAISCAFFLVLGKIELHKSHQTRLMKYHVAV